MKNALLFCLIFLSSVFSAFAQTSTPASQPIVEESEIELKNTTASNVDTTNPKTSTEPKAAIYADKKLPAEIPYFETAPTIDGQLNEAVWQNAKAFGNFLQTQPGDNVAPTAPTEAFIGFDAKNLYIAFRVKQDRNKIQASVSRRDNLGGDDFVGMYLDTFNDQRQAYFIFLNPLGIQTDGVFTEGNGEDSSVDILMESKGVLTDDGYIVEAAIPFKSLRYEAGKDKQWGLHLFRRIRYNNNELNSWMPRNRSSSGSLNQAGHITGLVGIETTRQLEINPSLTVSQTGRRTKYTFNGDGSGRYLNEGVKADFGFTAKFGLTPTITLDFAYNPDFAQVEADAPVTTANQRFPIFFSEKRPFFLERIDIFQTPINIVNTRAIIDPDVAAKITGRSGKNTFGVLYASDKAPGNFSPDERQDLFECIRLRAENSNQPCRNERFVDKNADVGIFRLKRDIGSQGNLGVLATTYNFVDRHNNTGGFDGRFRFDEKTVIEFQAIGTTTRGRFYDSYSDKTSYRTGNGAGYSVWLERAGRNLYMNYLATGRTRDYRADVGFTSRTDTNYLGSFIQYKTDPDSKKDIIFKRLQNSTHVDYDWLGRAQFWISGTQGMIALQKQTYVGGSFQFGREKVFEHEFGARRTATRSGAFFGNSERSANFKDFYAFIETTPIKQLFASFTAEYNFGQLDYDFGAGRKYPRASRAYRDYLAQCNADPIACEKLAEPGLDPGAGNQLYLEGQVRYQMTTDFLTQLNFTKTRLVRNDTGLTAFDDNIFSSRSTYQFNRNTFARLRVDYSTLSGRLRPQVVLGWTPSPGTAIYAGYNDDMSYNGYNPFNNRFEPGIHGNGRSFFIKASYLFKKSF